MKITNQCIQVLPDIEMYGGDTTPWQFYFAHDNGTYYEYDDVTGYTASLNVVPYYMSTGVSLVGTPVLTKTGTIKIIDGVAGVEFTLTSSDTIELSGKYVYQVEVTFSAEKRIGQGNLYIRTNINQ